MNSRFGPIDNTLRAGEGRDRDDPTALRNDPRRTEEQTYRLPSSVRNLFDLGTSPASPNSDGPQIPDTPSGTGGPYTSIVPGAGLSAGPQPTHSNRMAPAGVDAAVQIGDVAYFSGNHAQMVVGFSQDSRGQRRAVWASDTNQGHNFFVNDRTQNGEFVIFRNNNPNYNGERAAQRVLANAAPDYTGNCARAVRTGVNAGLGDREMQGLANARDFVTNQAPLQAAGFSLVASGTNADITPAQTQTAVATPRASGPSVGV